MKIKHSGDDCPHKFCFQCGAKEFVLGTAIGVMSTLMMVRLFW